jgi:hypothetical protein
MSDGKWDAFVKAAHEFKETFELTPLPVLGSTVVP